MYTVNFTPSSPSQPLDPKLKEALQKKETTFGSVIYSDKAAENYVRIVQNGERIEKVLIKK